MNDAERVFRPLPRTVFDANVNPQELARLLACGRQDFVTYWEECARELEWFSPWENPLQASAGALPVWFAGARVNIVHNALDRHIHTGVKNRLAFIWEGEAGDCRKYTYYELYREVNRLANGLRSLGIGKGDRLVLYLPSLPETLVAMLACARVGAVHCAVFTGFSGLALRQRIAATRARVVITADGFYRNGRLVPLKSVVDEALMSEVEGVESVLVVRRAHIDAPMTEGRDIWYDALIRQERTEASVEEMSPTDPLFITHVAGEDGQIRAVTHGHAGYMVALARDMHLLFDCKETDIFWSTGDLSWIIGHSYAVYGPLLAGLTSFLYEGHPLYPQADRMWDIVARYGVTVLYTAPTVIRMLMRYGSQYPRRHELRTLRLLGSLGEAIAEDTWLWLYQHIGGTRCPLLNTWCQTETGTCMIAPLPVSPLCPGSVHRALPGIRVNILDAGGRDCPAGTTGELVVCAPWPSMALDLPISRNFSAEGFVFCTGDTALRDEDGLFWLQGRSGRMVNIAGHSVSCAEIEKVLARHRMVRCVAVEGMEDRVKGQVLRAFVVLEEEFQTTEDNTLKIRQLKEHLRREIGPVVVLRSVVFVENLPL